MTATRSKTSEHDHEETAIEELAAEGVIGGVGPRHVSFTGPVMDLSTLVIDSGPAAGALLRGDGVDVVLLTPV